MAAAEVTILLNERQIYDLEWLEHCYKKVRFPNPKCEISHLGCEISKPRARTFAC